MSLLQRKYPFDAKGYRIRSSVLSAVIVFGLLYVMQPFGFNLYEGNKAAVAAGFGGITFACHALFSFAGAKLSGRFISKWTILSMSIWLLTMILFIGLCNFFFGIYAYNLGFSIALLPTFMYWTLVFGIIITAVHIAIQYNTALRKRLNELIDNSSEEQKDITVTIHDQSVRGKDIVIPINDFLYAEARKNNVAVYYVDNDSLVCTEIRSTLAAIMESMRYENIFQCHRSFLINTNNITSGHGNSNGYQLTLRNCTNIVPVSRTYVPKLKAFIS